MIQVFAQSLTLGEGGASIQGPAGFRFSSIGGIVGLVFKYLFAFGGFFMLLMIIAAGFTLLTAAGDAKKMEQGKERLLYAIVGFLIIFGSVFLVRIIGKILGIQEIQTLF
ncbi:hypothetical protein HY086_00575 [Candidatus Gottesmanbacteria bacterium]|nr:hypothetical protein [Candidatus Gottesmanbacteria bacterium]